MLTKEKRIKILGAYEKAFWKNRYGKICNVIGLLVGEEKDFLAAFDLVAKLDEERKEYVKKEKRKNMEC